MNFIKKIGIFFSQVGFTPSVTFYSFIGVPNFILNLIKLAILDKDGWKISILPMLSDRYKQSGIASGHYFHMDLWAAKLIYAINPDRIVDVGSRIDGFVAHILSFRAIEVFDFRELTSSVPGLTFKKMNLTIPGSTPLSYSDCVTCLHTIEHFGLGRYGDSLNISGWKIGLTNLCRMVSSGGHLIVAVPVGHERIEFDAHRVFNPNTIIEFVETAGFKLNSYSAVNDSGDFNYSIDPNSSNLLNYGCGCFHFIRN